MSKADLHIHTTFSDGHNEPEAIVDYVLANTDLSVIAITDHNTIDGALAAHNYWQNRRPETAKLEIIVGSEISTADGQILGLFLEQAVPRNLSAADTVAAIHEQGGLAIAPHPFTRFLPFEEFSGVGRQIADLHLDGVETRSSVPVDIISNGMTAVYNQFHARHAVLGSSNAHYLTMIGKTYTRFPGQTAMDFRQAVENRQVRAGGRINGPVAGIQILNYLAQRRQLPVSLRQDRHHRHRQFGLTIDVLEKRWGPLAILHCGGDLVVGNSDMLKTQGRQLLSAGLKYLVLDLAALDFLDSSGLGSLIVLQKLAHQVGGDLLLAGLNKMVALSMQVVQLDRFFRMFDSVDNALRTFTHTSPVSLYQLA